jgi:alcohol dehydrogenase class IV
MANPTDVDARGDLLYGAAVSGMALGATAAGLHHKLCHVLGGRFNLVHADAHSVILPHALAFNAPVLPDEMARLANALGVPGQDPAGALWDLAVASNVPTRLADLKGSEGPLQRAQLQGAADAAATEITVNPRPVTREDLLGILERAFDGQRPGV